MQCEAFLHAKIKWRSANVKATAIKVRSQSVNEQSANCLQVKVQTQMSENDSLTKKLVPPPTHRCRWSIVIYNVLSSPTHLALEFLFLAKIVFVSSLVVLALRSIKLEIELISLVYVLIHLRARKLIRSLGNQKFSLE